MRRRAVMLRTDPAAKPRPKNRRCRTCRTRILGPEDLSGFPMVWLEVRVLPGAPAFQRRALRLVAPDFAPPMICQFFRLTPVSIGRVNGAAHVIGMMMSVLANRPDIAAAPLDSASTSAAAMPLLLARAIALSLARHIATYKASFFFSKTDIHSCPFGRMNSRQDQVSSAGQLCKARSGCRRPDAPTVEQSGNDLDKHISLYLYRINVCEDVWCHVGAGV